MRLGFRGKLLASYLALVVVASGVSLVVLERVLGHELEARLDQRLEAQVGAAAEWVRVAGRPERLAVKLGNVVDARVVILDRSGAVIGDSEPEAGAIEGLAADVGPALWGETQLARRGSPRGEVYTVIGPVDVDRAIVLAVPIAAVEAPRDRLRASLGVIAAVGFAVALVLGLIVTRIVARPLRAMVATASRVAAGDYRVGPPSSAPDELGLLSRTLHGLADQVAGRLADVERERDLRGAVLSSLDEGVAAIEPGGAVRLANPSASRILGAAVGRPLAIAPVDALVAAAVERSAPASGEVVHDGRELSVTAVPLQGLDGAVVVVRDLTRVRRLETLRRDFVANLAHELRTPVSAIRGYAETLAGGVPDAPTRDEFVAVIHRNAERIGRLVADLLTLQELDARPPDQLASDRVVLADVAAEVVRTLGQKAAAAGAALAVAVPAELAVLADADGLERVLLNLVDNAIKYAPGPIRIDARATPDAIELVVEDRGPGIPDGDRDRVFERFFRLDPGRSRDRGGTGLGLAIVRHLVGSMGGTIRVDQASPTGARFVVRLRPA